MCQYFFSSSLGPLHPLVCLVIFAASSGVCVGHLLISLLVLSTPVLSRRIPSRPSPWILVGRREGTARLSIVTDFVFRFCVMLLLLWINKERYLSVLYKPNSQITPNWPPFLQKLLPAVCACSPCRIHDLVRCYYRAYFTTPALFTLRSKHDGADSTQKNKRKPL